MCRSKINNLKKNLFVELFILRYIYIYIHINFVEHNRHFLSTYFLVNPYILLYCFWNIRWELIDVFSIIVYIPSTFSPTLSHHQLRIYYKSDVTFAFALLLCKCVCIFKCPLGDCISDNNDIYVGLTSTTQSRRLTMHLSDTSSIAQHLKKHSCPTTVLWKILTDNTTILEHQNNKQKLQILEALHIRNMQPTLTWINFQTSTNVFKCL